MKRFSVGNAHREQPRDCRLQPDDRAQHLDDPRSPAHQWTIRRRDAVEQLERRARGRALAALVQHDGARRERHQGVGADVLALLRDQLFDAVAWRRAALAKFPPGTSAIAWEATACRSRCALIPGAWRAASAATSRARSKRPARTKQMTAMFRLSCASKRSASVVAACRWRSPQGHRLAVALAEGDPRQRLERDRDQQRRADRRGDLGRALARRAWRAEVLGDADRASATSPTRGR